MKAKELLAKQIYDEDLCGLQYVEKDLVTGKKLYSAKEAVNLAIEFARYHVEKALKDPSYDIENIK